MLRKIAMRHSTSWLMMVLLMVVGMMGCQQTVKVSDQNLLQIQYRELAALLAESDKRHGIVLVDARKPADFDHGHIPGAINIFLPDIVAGDTRLSKARNIVVSSNGWADPYSRAAGKRLMSLGYKNVVDFRGGIEAWRAEGRLLAVNRKPDAEPATPAN